jgi:hypothetical protein
MAIWGERRNFIIEFSSCAELATPFDIQDEQVTDTEYGPGGPIVRVHPADEYVIEQKGLLRPR